ncbi:hypothetical protein WA158_008063 [Blastocystis sp. Blastoise]
MDEIFIFTFAFANVDSIEGGKKVLVITSDNSAEATYSIYFDGLRKKGFDLKIALENKKVTFSKYGKFLYDQVIIFAPESEQLCNISAEDFRKFFEHGGDVVLALSNNPSKLVRTVAGDFGVDIEENGSKVIDHFNYATTSDNLDHQLVYTTQIANIKPLVGKIQDSSRVYYKGTGLVVIDNIFMINTLVGEQSTYSVNNNSEITSTGKDTVMVVSVQGRNNARVSLFGSIEMFSNQYSFFVDSINAAFVKHVTFWTFRQRGILRYHDVSHKHVDNTPLEIMLKNHQRPNLPISQCDDEISTYPEVAPNNVVYRVKDDVEYDIEIDEYSHGNWKGYNATDIQLEFRMLDPYVRINLEGENGHYHAQFKIPDVYGIYKFRVMYRRLGYSVIESNTQVSVRPFRHNEFPRFIRAAFPYYTSVFTVMAGFIVLVALFIFL